MTPEVGHAALVVALGFAVVQALVPMIGSFNGYRSWMRLGHSMALGQFAFMALSFACLANAFYWMTFLSDMSPITPIHCCPIALNLVRCGARTKAHCCYGH